jgi:hypothetical protein
MTGFQWKLHIFSMIQQGSVLFVSAAAAFAKSRQIEWHLLLKAGAVFCYSAAKSPHFIGKTQKIRKLLDLARFLH